MWLQGRVWGGHYSGGIWGHSGQGFLTASSNVSKYFWQAIWPYFASWLTTSPKHIYDGGIAGIVSSKEKFSRQRGRTGATSDSQAQPWSTSLRVGSAPLPGHGSSLSQLCTVPRDLGLPASQFQDGWCPNRRAGHSRSWQSGRAQGGSRELRDACSSSPERPSLGLRPDPWPPGSGPLPPAFTSLPLPAGLCKQLSGWGWTGLPPPPCTLSIPSPEPQPGFLRKIGWKRHFPCSWLLCWVAVPASTLLSLLQLVTQTQQEGKYLINGSLLTHNLILYVILSPWTSGSYSVRWASYPGKQVWESDIVDLILSSAGS